MRFLSIRVEKNIRRKRATEIVEGGRKDRRKYLSTKL